PIAPRAVLLRSAQGRRIFRCRSTRPGCECPPAAPKLPVRPNRTEGGAPTECARQTDLRCRSTRPGCEYPPAAPKLPARPNRTEGGAPTGKLRCRSTRPGCEYPPAAPELPARPNRTEAVLLRANSVVGAPAPGANARRRRRSCRHVPIAPRAVLLRSAQGRRIFAVGAPAPGAKGR